MSQTKPTPAADPPYIAAQLSASCMRGVQSVVRLGTSRLGRVTTAEPPSGPISGSPEAQRQEAARPQAGPRFGFANFLDEELRLIAIAKALHPGVDLSDPSARRDAYARAGVGTVSPRDDAEAARRASIGRHLSTSSLLGAAA